jgi:hypothetical protein
VLRVPDSAVVVNLEELDLPILEIRHDEPGIMVPQQASGVDEDDAPDDPDHPLVGVPGNDEPVPALQDCRIRFTDPCRASLAQRSS